MGRVKIGDKDESNIIVLLLLSRGNEIHLSLEVDKLGELKFFI